MARSYVGASPAKHAGSGEFYLPGTQKSPESGGRLVGVLDTGGFAAADPALDLVSAWHLLDDRQRPVLRELLGCSDVRWQRGMAWAFQQAMAWSGTTLSPTQC